MFSVLFCIFACAMTAIATTDGLCEGKTQTKVVIGAVLGWFAAFVLALIEFGGWPL